MGLLVGRVVISIGLLVAAGFAYREAKGLSQRADAHQQLATLRYEIGETDVRLDRATADYWQGRYDRLADPSDAIERDPDPELLLVAANAAFRESQQMPVPRGAQAQQLDLVLQAYATVLKSSVFVPDAAYNYEYVARLRDALTKPSRSGARVVVVPEVPSTDLPTGPTIHGRPGGPPPGTRGEDFEIITPMDFGDRETQPEPNPGGKPVRKG